MCRGLKAFDVGHGAPEASNLVVGSRVLVRPAQWQQVRKMLASNSGCLGVRPAENCPGSIRFLGYTQFADGEWFGVELEKPLGKNATRPTSPMKSLGPLLSSQDGKVKGVSYFSCPALHGIFARREHLLEAPSPETSPTTSPQSGVETEESSFAAAGSPKEEELKAGVNREWFDVWLEDPELLRPSIRV